MKVCLVADYVPGFHKKWSGAEIFCYRLYEDLKNKKVDAFIITTPFDKSSKTSRDPIQVPFLFNLESKIGKIFRAIAVDPVSIIFCLRILSKLKPDIIHIHSKYLLTPVIISAKILGIKTVYTFLDYYLLCQRNTFLKDDGTICGKSQGIRCAECTMINPLRKSLSFIFKYMALKRSWLNKYFITKIDRFITLTDASKRRIVSHGVSEKKISTVYYFRPRINANFTIDKDSFVKKDPLLNIKERYLLFVGSVSYHKGLDVLIAALPDIVSNFDDVKLLIGVGDAVPSHLKKINALIDKLNLKKSIIFLPKMDNEDVIKIIGRSHIVVVPEQWPNEFGPVILVEALFCGKPVVASNIGGIREFITDGYNGFTFEPKDAKDLSRKIVNLLENDELYNKLCKNSKQTLNSSIMFKNSITDVYREMIS